MIDPDTVQTSYERHRKARAKVRQRNKDAVFRTLAAAKITEVHVEFDGEGDDGQIHNVVAYRGNEPTELPPTTLANREVSRGRRKVTVTQYSTQEAIEALCYDCLADDHDGWENNAGAYGEFRLDVAARTVKLEINERYVDTHTTTRTF